VRIKPIMVLLVGETAKSSLKLLNWLEQSRLPLPTGAVLSGCLQSRVVHAVRPAYRISGDSVFLRTRGGRLFG
jgi:hypothetical protein